MIPIGGRCYHYLSSLFTLKMSLKKITLEQSFHCISFQDLQKRQAHKDPPNNEFSILIWYFTRDIHRDIPLLSHFQCDLLIYASFSKIDVKIPHHHITRIPEYYRRVSTWCSSTRKRQTTVSCAAWKWVIVTFSLFPCNPSSSLCSSTSLLLANFPNYVWNL